MKHLVFLFLFLAVCNSHSSAQDSLTIREAADMKIMAENLVASQLRDLLNGIANVDNAVSKSEMASLMSNSYAESRNKIFFNAEAIIEDDIDPTLTSTTSKRDSKVPVYLRDLDVLYTKTNSSSIIFTNVRASNPKKLDSTVFLYVYYNSFFRNPNKTNEKAYEVNNRLAEVQMKKTNNQWAGYIRSIRFFNPNDTLTNFYKNDIRLYDPRVDKMLRDSSASLTDSAALAAAKKRIEEEVLANDLKKALEERQAADAQYNDLISKGDKAQEAKDYVTALSFYKQAHDSRPNEMKALTRITQVNRIQEATALDNEKLYQNALTEARAAEKKRQYADAVRFYRKAVTLKPEKSGDLEQNIRQLNSRLAMVSELNEEFEASRNYKDLIDKYDDAIKKNKTNSDLYLGRGRCYDKLNNYSRALKDYTQAYDLDANTVAPNNAALKLRAELYTNHNEFFKALSDYETYLINDETDLSVYEAKADVRLRVKSDDYNGALNEVERGLRINAKSPQLLYKKGLLLASKNNYKEAIFNFNAATLEDSTRALTYFHRGKSYLATNNIMNAAYDFEAARRKGLDSANITTINRFAANFYQRAVESFRQSAKDSALVLLQYAIDIAPANADYRFTKGTYYLSMNRNSDAILSLNKAIELNDRYTEAYYYRGVAYFRLANYPAAAKNFTTAAEQNPRHYLAQKGLGDANFIMKKYADAANSYEGFVRNIKSVKNASDPITISHVYDSLGQSYYIQNQTDERALNNYKEAIRSNANYAEGYFDRGMYYYTKNNLSDAIADMGKAVSLNDKRADWSYHLAKAYQEKKDLQNAANMYRITISKDSLKHFPDALYLMANIQYQQLNYPEALTSYQQVMSLGLNDSIPAFDYELGSIYLNTGKPDAALKHLQAAHEKDSSNAGITYALATALYLQGKQDESMTWFEQALKTKQLSSSFIKKDKLIADLRNQKKFKEMMNKYY